MHRKPWAPTTRHELCMLLLVVVVVYYAALPQWAAATRPLRLCLLPTCIKRDKKAALVLLPIAPHWKHPPMHLIFHSSVHYYCPPFLEHCMQLLGRTTGGTFECYCTRYEEAACIKAAMTPFWSGPPLNPPSHPPTPISSCLPS